MRQFKFRAWDERNKRMIYPVGIINDDILIVPDETGKGDFLGLDLVPYMQLSRSAYPVMQYTGLKDKNGKEIYEGDVVQAEEMYPSVVIFENGTFRFEGGSSSIVEDFEYDTDFVVIGNVFENPDLMN